MKGVIYARYSSDNQREESIEGQLRECKEYAERNGITVLSSYIDRALSAKTDHRPDFQRMIKDSGKGLFDVVIVWKLDRFARNRYDSAHYKSVLRKNGVKVVSAKEAIAEDSTGILLESLLEGYAEFYSAELSEKVIRGLTDNALKTKYNGGGVPIGYIIDKEQRFQLDPATAPLVLDAFTLYDKGATMKELTDYLYKKGLCDRNNHPLKIDVVARLLKNRRYIGEYRYREIVQDGAIPAIVPVELFDRVQERMVKNKKAPARKKAKAEEYLLTTKLFCGYCGAPMVGESGTSHTNTVHRYKAAHGFNGHDISRCCGIWPASSVVSILDDERYTGTYIMGKREVMEVGGHRVRMKDESQWIKIPDHHPAIISRELFEQVQAQRPRFKCPKKNARVYLRFR